MLDDIVESYIERSMRLGPPHGPDCPCYMDAMIRAAAGHVEPVAADPWELIGVVIEEPRRGGWPAGRARSLESRWRQGAAKIGVPYAEYREHMLAGDRWCKRHRGWVAAERFATGYCRNCRNDYERARYYARSGRPVPPIPAPPGPTRWKLGPQHPDYRRERAS